MSDALPVAESKEKKHSLQ